MADAGSSGRTPMDAQTASVSQEFEGIDVTTEKDGGVIKQIIKEGIGDDQPHTGDTVHVHYVGTLLDGTTFDSSRDRKEMFTFNIGRGSVIKAWDIGVATMKRGEICKLICKPSYAYGESGSPPKIPPNATLIFEVELYNWEGEDVSPEKDKTIFRSVQVEGEKYEKPNEGSTCEVHAIGRYQGQIFMDSDVSFVLGECTEKGLPEGIDRAMKQFKKGERSLINIKPKWGYGAAGKPEYNIPPYAELDFDITLTNFEKAKDSWQMNDEEKLAESEKLKARGTDYFQGKIKLAIAKYKRIIDFLQYETTWEGEKKEKRNQLYLPAHLNLALCFLKNGDTAECIKHCDKALEEDKKNVKALYRHGQANQAQCDFDKAVVDYQHVLEIEPENNAAKLGIQQCKQKMKEQAQRDKNLYSSMFKKLGTDSNKENKEVDSNHDVPPPPLVPFEDSDNTNTSQVPESADSTAVNGNSA